MTKKLAAPVGLNRAVLAAAMALALASPAYSADKEPTIPQAADDRAAVVEAKPADNSAHNSSDVSGDSLTPLDQSHTEADVEMTRTIRKMLVDDDTLGTNARNIKVITVDGMVTLRGAVENADEQARIVAIAKDAAGLDRVLSELQVIER